ncbi:hypothetical protein F4778DRAFT_801773 [Xylariomycetidae sp. FL2044]|nr:hypothetical protein F4778DRAFT_801773 [Xylariomycetidae sp. FL2044]
MSYTFNHGVEFSLVRLRRQTGVADQDRYPIIPNNPSLRAGAGTPLRVAHAPDDVFGEGSPMTAYYEVLGPSRKPGGGYRKKRKDLVWCRPLEESSRPLHGLVPTDWRQRELNKIKDNMWKAGIGPSPPSYTTPLVKSRLDLYFDRLTQKPAKQSATFKAIWSTHIRMLILPYLGSEDIFNWALTCQATFKSVEDVFTHVNLSTSNFMNLNVPESTKPLPQRNWLIVSRRNDRPLAEDTYEKSMNGFLRLTRMVYYHGVNIHHLHIHTCVWLDIVGVKVFLTGLPYLKTFFIKNCELLTMGDLVAFHEEIATVNKKRLELNRGLLVGDLAPFIWSNYGALPEFDYLMHSSRGTVAILLKVAAIACKVDSKNFQKVYAPGTGLRDALDRMPFRIDTLPLLLVAITDYTIFTQTDNGDKHKNWTLRHVLFTILAEMHIALVGRPLLLKEDLELQFRPSSKPICLRKCHGCHLRLPAYLFRSEMWTANMGVCGGCQLAVHLKTREWNMCQRRRMTVWHYFTDLSLDDTEGAPEREIISLLELIDGPESQTKALEARRAGQALDGRYPDAVAQEINNMGVEWYQLEADCQNLKQQRANFRGDSVIKAQFTTDINRIEIEQDKLLMRGARLNSVLSIATPDSAARECEINFGHERGPNWQMHCREYMGLLMHEHGLLMGPKGPRPNQNIDRTAREWGMYKPLSVELKERQLEWAAETSTDNKADDPAKGEDPEKREDSQHRDNVTKKNNDKSNNDAAGYSYW